MFPRRTPALAVIVLGVLAVLAVPRGDAQGQSAVAITIVHLNDVYEIGAIEGGHFGGLARVASVVGQLKRSRAPVLTTLGGDYLSPSAIGTAVVDGQPLAGRQMVDVLNRVPVEWATFGNHEFDVSEEAFHARIAEGRFQARCEHVTDAEGSRFRGPCARRSCRSKRADAPSGWD